MAKMYILHILTEWYKPQALASESQTLTWFSSITTNINEQMKITESKCCIITVLNSISNCSFTILQGKWMYFFYYKHLPFNVAKE